jgi:ABC-2 type transport system permease protein
VSAAGAIPRGAPILAAAARKGGGVGSAFRTERRKLTSQLAIRLLALLCVLGPFAFAAVLKVQSGTPTDALLGAWVHSSGLAISLVVLGFAGSWGFPLMAGVLAGDMFSSEDRHGTWKTILTRSCTRREVFAGKLLAAMAFSIGLVALTAVSSLVAGLALVGDQSLVDLSGALLSPGRGLALVLVSWLLCALPVLAYTSLAVLFSVATRNGIMGVIGPILVALVTQLLALIGNGVWAHLLLIGSAFDGWHGLFVTHRFYGPLVASSVVSVAWIAACLGASWLILRRRDFVGTAVGGNGWLVSFRIIAAAVAVIALLAFAGSWGPVGVTAARLRASIGPDFNNLTLLQQHLLGRAIPPGATLDLRPSCNRGAAAPDGPGEWTCNVNVFIPELGKVPFQQNIVTYDVSVQANGCYKAASPPRFVGQQTMRDARGQTVTNPLFVVYGCFNTL